MPGVEMTAIRRFVLLLALVAVVPLAVSMAGALAGCGGVAALPPSAASPLGGKALPDFQRRSIAGDSVDTKSLRGRVVVVKFFAKYCEPCRRTLPAAQALSGGHPEVAFIGVAEDELESDVREIVATYGLTFPVIHDRGNVLSGRYRVNEMPITFVADARGVVRWVGGAEQSEEDLAHAIAATAR